MSAVIDTEWTHYDCKHAICSLLFLNLVVRSRIGNIKVLVLLCKCYCVHILSAWLFWTWRATSHVHWCRQELRQKYAISYACWLREDLGWHASRQHRNKKVGCERLVAELVVIEALTIFWFRKPCTRKYRRYCLSESMLARLSTPCQWEREDIFSRIYFI